MRWARRRAPTTDTQRDMTHGGGSDWRDIDDIFALVLDSPVDERAAVLEHAAADDPELGAAVAALFAALQDAGSFLETPLEELGCVAWPEILEIHPVDVRRRAT